LSNDFLSITHTADRLSGLGVLPFLFKEVNGATLAAAPEAYIVKMAPITRGKNAGDIQWKIKLVEAEMFVGGLIR
jgi:hypothetical protein